MYFRTGRFTSLRTLQHVRVSTCRQDFKQSTSKIGQSNYRGLLLPQPWRHFISTWNQHDESGGVADRSTCSAHDHAAAVLPFLIACASSAHFLRCFAQFGRPTPWPGVPVPSRQITLWRWGQLPLLETESGGPTAMTWLFASLTTRWARTHDGMGLAELARHGAGNLSTTNTGRKQCLTRRRATHAHGWGSLPRG